jgi:hypothetical protein
MSLYFAGVIGEIAPPMPDGGGIWMRLSVCVLGLAMISVIDCGSSSSPSDASPQTDAATADTVAVDTAAANDVLAPDDTGDAGGLPFGATCTGDSECASNLCHTFPSDGSRTCSITCTGPSGCPPEAERCNGEGFCKPKA